VCLLKLTLAALHVDTGFNSIARYLEVVAETSDAPGIGS